MLTFERAQISILLKRSDEQPKWLISENGPRQSGKTTLVKQAMQKLNRPSLYRSADEYEPSELPSPPSKETIDFEAPDHTTIQFENRKMLDGSHAIGSLRAFKRNARTKDVSRSWTKYKNSRTGPKS